MFNLVSHNNDAKMSPKRRTLLSLVFASICFEFPARIHSDQGGEFENNLFRQLHKLSCVSKSRTSPLTPTRE